MSNIWEQLGGLIYTGSNLRAETLALFKKVGGAWVCPYVYGDVNQDYNRAHITEWRSQGLIVGGTFNPDPNMDPLDTAREIADVARQYTLAMVQLDMETAYQWPKPTFMKMPPTLRELRRLLPLTHIAVNTNGLNDAMLWNGGPDYPSVYGLSIRVSPQWYSSPRYTGSCWTDPVCNMKDEKLRRGIDNFYEPKQKYGRAVPLSFIHPSVEPTGVEDAVLENTLVRLLAAKGLGFTRGFNLYALERVPDSDFKLVEQYRGKLYV